MSTLSPSLTPAHHYFPFADRFEADIFRVNNNINNTPITEFQDLINKIVNLKYYYTCATSTLKGRDLQALNENYERIKELVADLSPSSTNNNSSPSSFELNKISSIASDIYSKFCSLFTASNTEAQITPLTSKDHELFEIPELCSLIESYASVDLSKICASKKNWVKKLQTSEKKSITYKELLQFQTDTSKKMEALFLHLPNLNYLDLSSSDINDKKLIAIIGKIKKFCPHITSINLSYCLKVTDKGIAVLAQNFPQLTYVNLCGCKITDLGLTALAQGCPGLTFLNLLNGYAITDNGLMALAQYCPDLKEINLGFSSCTDKGLIPLVQNCPLTSVSLSACKITDQLLITLAKFRPQLHTLHLSCCEITDHGLVALSQGCNQLISVSLWGCSQITNNGRIALAESCPQLVSLCLSNNGIVDEELKAIAQKCQQLTFLKLTYCDHLTDQGLIASAQSLPHLIELDVSFCQQITGSALTPLIQKCAKLVTIISLAANQLSDSELQKLRNHITPSLWQWILQKT